MNPNRLIVWTEAVNRMGRPFLTVLVTLLYNGTLLAAVCLGSLPIKDYITAIGPVNAMVMGFWFGERSRVRDEEDKK